MGALVLVMIMVKLMVKIVVMFVRRKPIIYRLVVQNRTLVEGFDMKMLRKSRFWTTNLYHIGSWHLNIKKLRGGC